MNCIRRWGLLATFASGVCLVLGGCGAADEAVDEEAEWEEAAQTEPQSATGAGSCHIWKGRGGAPPGYMAASMKCVPGSPQQWGFSFYTNTNGVSYYRGTVDGSLATTSEYWAVYSNFATLVTTSKTEHDAFISGMQVTGSCSLCVY